MTEHIFHYRVNRLGMPFGLGARYSLFVFPARQTKGAQITTRRDSILYAP